MSDLDVARKVTNIIFDGDEAIKIINANVKTD